MNDLNGSFSPYKGLMPFTEEDSDIFFGRKAEQKVIAANLLSSRLTLLYGSSGVGKSSVLEAGVVHMLRQKSRKNMAKNGNPKFIISVFRSWSDDPIPALISAIQKSILQVFDNQSLEISGNPRDVKNILNNWTEKIQCDLLIVFDQFEEYFLYHSNERNERKFAREFVDVVNSPNLRVNFLVSLRDDTLAKLDFFKGKIPHLFDNYLRITHLDRKAATEAIKEPIYYYNRAKAQDGELFDVDPILISSVLEQVRVGKVIIGDFGRGQLSQVKEDEIQIETSYLQLVMKQLWDTEKIRGSKKLRLRTLKDLGNVEGIVNRHVHDVMNKLSPTEKDVAVEIFHHLVTPSGTKIAHTVKDLAGFTKYSYTEISDLLVKLSDSPIRIVRSIPPGQIDQMHFDKKSDFAKSVERELKLMTRYEIYHDVLASAVLHWRIQYMHNRDKTKGKKKAVRWGGIIAIIALVSGIALGVLSYRWNWFNSRTIYLAGKNSNPMDVINWLLDKNVIGNIVLDDISNPQTQKALVALRFAYDIEKDGKRTGVYLDQILRASQMQTRPRTATLGIIKNNVAILHEIYDIVPYPPIKEEIVLLDKRSQRMQDSTSASTIFENLERQYADEKINDTTLVNGYKILVKNYPDFIDTNKIKQQIHALELLIASYDSVLRISKSDTMTIFQKQAHWTHFFNKHQRKSPEKSMALEQITEITNLMDNSAIIDDENNFVTCRGVKDMMPFGISEHFSAGNIWVWAKIRSPKSERIHIKWYNQNSLFHTSTFSVAASAGYRIYAAKNYNQECVGKNEVRLYNSNNTLIGRKTFFIN